MNTLLDIAIQAEGGVSRLARSLGMKPNTVTNWKSRGVPKPWAIILTGKYQDRLIKHLSSQMGDSMRPSKPACQPKSPVTQ